MKSFITLNPRKTKRFISCDSKANLLNLLSMFVLKMLKVKYFKESCPICQSVKVFVNAHTIRASLIFSYSFNM